MMHGATGNGLNVRITSFDPVIEAVAVRLILWGAYNNIRKMTLELYGCVSTKAAGKIV